ncbi:MAG: Gfo/Idh/MocA family protein [Silvania sp.]
MNNYVTGTKPIKWGIIAPGKIAHKFASDLLLSDGSELIAVASRSKERAVEFAHKFQINEVYNDYEQLLQTSRCDVVYIASPHVFHKQHVLSCIKAGKAVLCEKPVTLSSHDFKELQQAATDNQVFFMEAMWTRFFPIMDRVLEIITSGRIGKVNLVQANFGFKAEEDFSSRLYDPHLGGGSLLDTGVYVLTLAQMVFQRAPIEVLTQAVMTQTGVDGTGSYLLRYGETQLAMLSTSITTKTDNTAMVYGEKGSIEIDNFWMPDKAIIRTQESGEEVIHNNNIGTGYYYEIKDVEACLAAGLLQNPKRTLASTYEVLEIMDRVRDSWGLVYPSEK